MTRLCLLAALALGTAGCFGNIDTPFDPDSGVAASDGSAGDGGPPSIFPNGLAPWELPNAAPRPTATATDPCPETLELVERTWTRGTLSMHGKACIQVPIAEVWRVVRDPQTGRDPTTTSGFRIVAYETEPQFDYTYKTHFSASFGTEFDLSWRHGVVTGTDQAPTLTATRWQKTFGSSAISVLEGSLVLSPLEGHPEVTLLEYQYHLNALTASYDTIRAYLGVIYGRLRDKAHGRPLDPSDCTDCPAAPQGY